MVKFPITNKIAYWYGRYGNNIQQLIVGIYFSIKNKTNFQSGEHDFIKPISIRSNKNFLFNKKIEDIFFFQYEKNEKEIISMAPTIIKKYIKPNLKFNKFNQFDLGEDTLVIHIRSGDLWRDNGDYNKLYVQNPLSYYLKLIKLFKKNIVITEIDLKNPILKILRDDYRIPIISSSVFSDFSILMSAKNLSSSGVGTFSIAAALLSDNLKNFYASNLFLNEQINPKTLLNFNFKINILNVNNYLTKWYNNEVCNNALIYHQDIDKEFILQN